MNHKEAVVWKGPQNAVLSADLYLDGYVAVYGYGSIYHSEVRVPVDDFKIWASTILAEIALAERKAKP